MRINTNVSSLIAQESTTKTYNSLSKSLKKISSGLAINKASDNASGLAIADKLRTQASSADNSTLEDLKALDVDGLTTALAGTYQDVVDDSISALNDFRSEIGSTQVQLDSAVNNLATLYTNVSGAESIIRSVDYAIESSNFNKQNIMAQAGSYAISQANVVSQNVLYYLT